MASALRGKLDARRQLMVGACCAKTGAARVAPPATAPSVAFFKNERRCMNTPCGNGEISLARSVLMGGNGNRADDAPKETMALLVVLLGSKTIHAEWIYREAYRRSCLKH